MSGVYERLINLFQQHQIDSSLIDLLKRFCVYHAGCLLEILYNENTFPDKKSYIKGFYAIIDKYFTAYENGNEIGNGFVSIKKAQMAIDILLACELNKTAQEPDGFDGIPEP